jgi:hypothetical protein
MIKALFYLTDITEEERLIAFRLMATLNNSVSIDILNVSAVK